MTTKSKNLSFPLRARMRIQERIRDTPFEINSLSKISPALYKSLCYINRVTNSGANGVKPRILIISVSEDNESEYFNFINGVFSAQRMGVVLDGLVFSHLLKTPPKSPIGMTSQSAPGQRPTSSTEEMPPSSVFLSQGCELTKGLYLEPKRENLKALHQYLMQALLMDVESRKIFAMTYTKCLKLITVCLCCSSIVNKGYVCSKCLAVYCEKTRNRFNSKCFICNSRFDLDDQ
eukprot:TRINITY_DN7335_c0_g1_i1.p1 TRINITY_DN7335_c0_g1~~TRINITY_DN7335_c0_g1_i1.p1  ORF type:complete len:233 (-),score=24.48 TRINITY_DN7335_c0_g1_i1:215-913(-)